MSPNELDPSLLSPPFKVHIAKRELDGHEFVYATTVRLNQIPPVEYHYQLGGHLFKIDDIHINLENGDVTLCLTGLSMPVIVGPGVKMMA